MAAKLLHSLADDNPDFQKQIGCMNGIFQLFDRHNALTNRRLVQKRLPAGNSQLDDDSPEKDFNNVNDQQIASEATKSASEKQIISTESSRASLSSSCSSLSSLDLCKSVQPEVSPFDRVVFPETPSRDPALNHGSTSPHLERQSLMMRDVVKDSMYRETRGLSSRTDRREETLTHVSKHQDSPRPSQLSKYAGGPSGSGKISRPSIPEELKESLKVMVKLREMPWYSEESMDFPTSLSTSKDVPRFSYDGRERNRLSFESRETIKSSAKLKDLPRLSLDSREQLMQSSNINPKADYLLKNPQTSSNDELPIRLQISGCQKRPPSVVAKLMGLETFPDCAQGSNSHSDFVKSSLAEENGPFLKPLLTKDLRRPTPFHNLPRNSPKDPTSPRRRSTDVVMKPISSSRVPIEPAPWKQPDGNRVSKNAASRPSKSPARTAEPVSSVYSEIEKRLKDLEFKQSGKDLRALKQIIEAIQAKGVLEARKEEVLNQSLTSMSHVNNESSHVDNYSTRKSDSSRTFESPIVIMKPARLAGKSSISTNAETSNDGNSSVRKYPRDGHGDSKRDSVNCRIKDQTTKTSHREFPSSSSDKKVSSRNVKLGQSSTRSQSPKKVNTTSTVSPRLQQKRLELEKRSRPPIPPSSNLNNTRRHSSRQPTDSGSPGGKSRIKYPNLQKSDEQLNEFSNDTRNSSFYDDVSLPSDGNVSLDTNIDLEVTSVEQFSIESSSSRSPSLKTFQHSVIDSMNKELTERSNVYESTDHPPVGQEHTSPVSVLEASVYQDDSPSPVEQIPDVVKDDPTLDTNVKTSETGWYSDERFSPENMQSVYSKELNRQKLQNVDNLVQKLRQLNSNHDEASTDYIASLCETTNPDHRYISEILLASGLLLRDLGSDLRTFQLHPSGDAINPELFLVLEQTKGNTYISKEESIVGEKIHRRLIFDAVNDLITEKLSLIDSSAVPMSKPNKLAKTALSARMLLTELCLEIEQLQANHSASSIEEEEDDLKFILLEDVLHRSESWTDFSRETSGIVLDVERRIFKDLVDEIVIGGSVNSGAKRLRRRKLVK